MQSITLKRPDDWHIHLRDDAYLARTVGDAARYFGRVLVMPNLVPPVTSVERATAYRNRILEHAPAGFSPLMALYLTEETSKDTVAAVAETPFTPAFKLYPAGATTNSAFGISTIEKMFPIFDAMQEQDVILSIHGEVTDQDIDIFDREAVFIDRILSHIAATFPSLRIILEHITTREAVDFIRGASDKVAGTITAHHLLYNRNDMLVGGMKPVHYCLPVLKRNVHQAALIGAATSGDSSFFIGTDSAPHPRHAKENACGCAAGCYTAHAALELYAEVFETAGKLERLEAFTSEFGADFYQLPHNADQIELVRKGWQVEPALTFGNDQLVPTRGGDVIRWQVIAGNRPSLSDGAI
ncbi:MAG: dihydroorotase [Candidatus Azotimanducaceae bacterium WSBS_2022_MAG_OTU7]